jgi:excisionase family DNA binding protein
MDTGPPEFLTIKEAAVLLRVSEPTIHRWIATGELPSSKIGRRRLIARKDIDAILEMSRKK